VACESRFFRSLKAISAVPDATFGRFAPAPVALTWARFAATTVAATGHRALTRQI